MAEEDKRALEEQERKEREKEKRRIEKEERERRALEKEAEKKDAEKSELERKKALEKATTPKKRKGTKGVITEEGAAAPPTKKPRSSAPMVIRLPKPTVEIEAVSTAKKARPSKKLKPNADASPPPAKQKPPSSTSATPRAVRARERTLRRCASMPTRPEMAISL